MPFGVVFALAAYALFSFCDSLIKGMGVSLSPFEVAFYTTAFSLLPAIVSTPKGETWRGAWRMQHPWLVQLRAASGVFGTLCVIYAFTHIPLAEVYSLAFLAPIFVVLLSASVLKEEVPRLRWILLAVSFFGVLLVVRPGFRELNLGHLAALGAAFFSAVNTTVLRVVASDEKRVSLIGVTAAYALVFNGAIMAPGFQLPDVNQFLMLAMIGLLGGTGHILFIAATRRVGASEVAPAQYSQILWAILLGALFYAEIPDAMTVIGLVIVALAGVLNIVSDETRIRVIARFSIGRARLGELSTKVLKPGSATEI